MAHERIPRLGPRALAMVLLGVSAALAVATLGSRNLYDDEISSLPVITGSLRTIVQFSAFDVHPPGMYLLAHFALKLVPSFRWVNLVPTAMLYAGLCVFVLNVAPLFRSHAARAIFVFLATLHPQFMLWGTSYRWYSWWTGLALITLVVALQPARITATFSSARAIILGILLAGLFYINYITLLFAICLAVALLMRYSGGGKRRLLWLVVLAGGVFLGLIAPQMHTFFHVYVERGAEQRATILISGSRLIEATFSSEAYLPLHPLAIVGAVTLMSTLVAAVWLRRKRSASEDLVSPVLKILIVFGTLFFLLIALLGLGAKPRSGLLLIPVLAVAFARAIAQLPRRVQYVSLLLLALWSAGGIAHMLTRTGLSKSMMVEHPEEVAAYVRETSPRGCAVVATLDAALAFEITQSRLPRTFLLAPFEPPIADPNQTLPADCTQVNLFVTYSYLGGGAEAETIDHELDSAAQLIQEPRQRALFSFDPDAAGRRRLTRWPLIGRGLQAAASLPDYRYVVVAGRIAPASLPALHARLPDFRSYDAQQAASK